MSGRDERICIDQEQSRVEDDCCACNHRHHHDAKAPMMRRATVAAKGHGSGFYYGVAGGHVMVGRRQL
jgi:hypothetical protein